MNQQSISPAVLVILDGWGYRETPEGNAIARAKTPVMDSLCAGYPNTLIRTSGKDVGLPEGQMGNSEVGHLNLGAGRVVPQELVRISDAVEDGSIQENLVLGQACQNAQANHKKLHLVGLCSEGGVHSHLKHLIGLVEMAKAKGVEEICIHAITDGRDTNPTDGVEAIRQIEDCLQRVGLGRIVTVSGRYYAMDRDRRWDRTEKAYNVMVEDSNGDGRSAEQVLQDAYAEGITDEFVIPQRVDAGAVESGDSVIFFNFRPDRARQLTQAFVVPDFDGFQRDRLSDLTFVTFTQYDATLPVLVAFPPQNLTNLLGEVIANHGLQQFRTAETEKYAHVTYFFNGGNEKPFPGEDRELIPSPMVPTYDREPQMSAQAVTDTAIAAIEKGTYSFVVINYANPDMVGHTGNMEAAIQAIETVDACLGRLLQSISQAGGTAIVTADHGNSECMLDDAGNIWTAHTTNLVPFIFVEGERAKIPGHGANVTLREDGRLADIAPTILDILQLPQPQEMTGRSMIAPAEVSLRSNRTPVSLGL
jgi:2,3-bisphosphoglycerate-independent phosphoglycerate mutase